MGELLRAEASKRKAPRAPSVSRPSPPRLDGWDRAANFALSIEQIAAIEKACGVSLNADAQAELAQVLGAYLSTFATDAPTIDAADRHLEEMRRLAERLRGLIGDPTATAPVELRARVREDLDWSDNAASNLHAALGSFLGAVPAVADSLIHRRTWNDDPREKLANELAIIWQVRLSQARTIGQQSPFVNFVRAATDCLPNHWPWRPQGRREPQSLAAFAQAVDRALGGALHT